jgi:hypothetical protein
LEIDRELALRRELGATASTLESAPETARLRGRDRRKADREFDGTLQRRMNDAGHSLPASRTKRSGVETWREEGRANAGVPSSADSSVMRDAFEVVARRKRQLGKGRP